MLSAIRVRLCSGSVPTRTHGEHRERGADCTGIAGLAGQGKGLSGFVGGHGRGVSGTRSERGEDAEREREHERIAEAAMGAHRPLHVPDRAGRVAEPVASVGACREHEARELVVGLTRRIECFLAELLGSVEHAVGHGSRAGVREYERVTLDRLDARQLEYRFGVAEQHPGQRARCAPAEHRNRAARTASLVATDHAIAARTFSSSDSTSRSQRSWSGPRSPSAAVSAKSA